MPTSPKAIGDEHQMVQTIIEGNLILSSFIIRMDLVFVLLKYLIYIKNIQTECNVQKPLNKL